MSVCVCVGGEEETDRQMTHRMTDRQTDRQRETHTHRQTHRERDRDRDREGEKVYTLTMRDLSEGSSAMYSVIQVLVTAKGTQ